jgi:hypothetical protein
VNIQVTDNILLREIGQIAHQRQRTPEQIVTEALKLYIRQLSPEPKNRGREENTGQISLETLMEKTKSVLQYFERNAETIMAQSEPGQDSGLLEVMNRLAERLNTAENEADLLDIANIVYDLTVRIPHFPPDDSPRCHFRLEKPKQMPGSAAYCRHIEEHKAALQEVFAPCFKRIEQAWRGFSDSVPPDASESPPWDLMGIFQDDPSWLEIEQERSRGGETE